MAAKLKVAIAAGGTAGHVNPALALAEELRSRGHDVRFFGESRRLEGKLVPAAGFPFTPIHVTGFDRERPWTVISALANLARTEGRLVRDFKRDAALRPDVAVGFGAYIELPLVRAAAKLGIPYALHEQNSVPGLANKQAAKGAALIGIAQPAVRAVFEQRGASPEAIELVGNPVRASVLAGDRARGRAEFGVPEGATLLVVFGGSLGAHHLNERMVALKDELLSMEGVHVLHSTGADDFEATERALALDEAEAQRYHVRPYIDDMGDVLAAADLVLSRAGASSIAEIAALAVPAVLVPYPHATADHQTTNARYLVDAGAAEMCADAAIDEPAFADMLLGLLRDPQRRAEMRAHAEGLGQARAAERFADAVERIAR